MQSSYRSKLEFRNENGSVAAVLFCLILLVVLVFACVSIDVAHTVHVLKKMQAATDAGALAGVVEIAKKDPTEEDIARAASYALAVTGQNEADNVYFKNQSQDTNVSVHVDVDSDPKTVTVTVSRKVNFLFSNVLNFGKDGNISLRPDALLVESAIASNGSQPGWVSSSSTAAPFLIKSVYPYQLVGIIPSIDHVPTSGPAKGQKISDILNSDQPIELAFNPQKDKNVGWVKDWLDNNQTTINIGESWRLQNGVVNSALGKINVGDVIGMPLTSGGVPMNDSRPILGVVTVQVIAKGSKSLTVKMHEPLIFHGVKGSANVNTSSENQAFLERWQPWTVQLIK